MEITNQLAFSAGARINDNFFISDNYINALLKIDIKSLTMQYVCAFPNESEEATLLHGKAYEYYQFVIFIPNQGKNVHLLDTNSMKITAYPIDRVNGSRYAINDSVMFDEKIWIFPGDGENEIISINLSCLLKDKGKLQIKKHGVIDSSRYKKRGTNQIFYHIAKVENRVYMAEYKSDVIVTFDLLTGEKTIVDTNIDKIMSLYSLDENLWIITQMGKIYSKIAGEDTMKEYIIPANYGGKDIMLFSFNHEIYGTLEEGGKLLKLDKNSCQFFVIPTVSLATTNNSTMGNLYNNFFQINDNILFSTPYSLPVQMLRKVENGEVIRNVNVIMENVEKYSDYRMRILKKRIGNTLLNEGEMMSLDAFLNIVCS